MPDISLTVILFPGQYQSIRPHHIFSEMQNMLLIFSVLRKQEISIPESITPQLKYWKNELQPLKEV